METGFLVFDTVHLSWIICILVFCIGMTFLYRSSTTRLKTAIRRTIAYTLLIGEIIKIVVVLSLGKSLLYYLPIHLCGLAIVLIMFHAYRSIPLITEILFSLTLPGAAIALLFPGWTDEPVMSFLHIHSFMYHALILTYPIMLLAASEMIPRAKRLWQVALFLLVTIPLIYWFNKVFETNYMFLNWPIPNSPLMEIYHLFGKQGYVFGLMLVAVVLWVIQYGIWELVSRINNKKLSKAKA